MKGFIYKIYSNENNMVYIGSTLKTLKKRMNVHISHNIAYIRNLYKVHKKNIKKPTIYPLFIANMQYKILDEFEVNDRAELIQIEAKYVNLYKKLDDVILLNKNQPGRNIKQIYIDQREKRLKYQKEYYKKMKEKQIIENMKIN
ncbi:MAG: GIY-YIG nuclease family protein [Arcobacter sp.]|nr:GIY-YIG nuclease family protein [Arcobacter sp.]